MAKERITPIEIGVYCFLAACVALVLYSRYGRSEAPQPPPPAVVASPPGQISPPAALPAAPTPREIYLEGQQREVAAEFDATRREICLSSSPAERSQACREFLAQQ